MNKQIRKPRIKYGFLAALLLFMICSATHGQEIKVIRDFKLWSGVELEKSVGKDWKFSLEEEFRFQEDASETGSALTEAGVEYRVDRNISLSAKYRYTRNRKKNDAFEDRSRYSFDLNYEGETRMLSLHGRLRFQKEVESLDIFNLKIPYEKHLRGRIELRYQGLGRFEPYVSGEIFQLHEINSFPVFEKYRLMSGLRIDVHDHGDAKISYGIDRELNSYYPYTYYILKLNYTFEF